MIERIIPSNYVAYTYRSNDATKPVGTHEPDHNVVEVEDVKVKNNKVKNNKVKDDYDDEDYDDYEDEDNDVKHYDEKVDDVKHYDEKVDKKVDEQVNEDKFWNIVALLGWRCRSDGEAKLHHIQRNLKPDEISYLKRHIPYFANHIEENVKKYGWLSKSSYDQIKNFTYHVVGMGQQMYLASIADIEVIQYMWDTQPPEYQDLYTMLQNF